MHRSINRKTCTLKLNKQLPFHFIDVNKVNKMCNKVMIQTVLFLVLIFMNKVEILKWLIQFISLLVSITGI